MLSGTVEEVLPGSAEELVVLDCPIVLPGVVPACVVPCAPVVAELVPVLLLPILPEDPVEPAVCAPAKESSTSRAGAAIHVRFIAKLSFRYLS